jgi:hypothetical protein
MSGVVLQLSPKFDFVLAVLRFWVAQIENWSHLTAVIYDIWNIAARSVNVANSRCAPNAY